MFSSRSVGDDRERVPSAPPEALAEEVTGLRAEAQIAALEVTEWPVYGSLAWLRLSPRDPRCYAATLEAAERYRRAEADRVRHEWLMDHDPEVWWREAIGGADAIAARLGRALAARRTVGEIRAARHRSQVSVPRPLRATPGWPPVAVPGQPGRYLTAGGEGG
ncbi:hypothetical protein ACFVIM_05845 [Streptomyces sp. NPDC057638]|uniref:hypothetical protein n=1 Tax=Streptomyces sp. NPDC057638 TaxID=3346190 RepID=UPI0036895308